MRYKSCPKLEIVGDGILEPLTKSSFVSYVLFVLEVGLQSFCFGQEGIVPPSLWFFVPTGHGGLRKGIFMRDYVADVVGCSPEGASVGDCSFGSSGGGEAAASGVAASGVAASGVAASGAAASGVAGSGV